MKKVLFRMFVFSALLITPTLSSYAEDQAPAAAEGEMTEEQKAKMASMQAYSTVSEHHAVLKALEGKWATTVKFWMDPKGEPQESAGTSESTLIFGGRFLEQKFSSDMMGQPFEGRGIFGYDNMRKEYTGLWFDNMSTGIMVSAAQYDAQAKVFAESGSMSCPLTNETHREYRAVTTLVDADHYTYETYMKDEEGNEFKSMIITYTRAQ